MKNMQKIREMKKQQELERIKPNYTLSYIKLVSGKTQSLNCSNCLQENEGCDKCYDHLVHNITDVERHMIWSTPFNVLLKDLLKNSK